MNELSDGVYKFVIVGRIFFVATCLITAILLTVTAIKASNVPVSVIQDPDTSFTTKEDSKDNPEVPIAGDISEDSSKESKNHEEKPAEVPTEQTPQQASTQPASVNTASHSEPNSNPTPSKPARPAFDYDKVYYIDDNDPDASSIPIIPGNIDNPSSNTSSNTISNANSDTGGNTSENAEPVEAANSGENS